MNRKVTIAALVLSALGLVGQSWYMTSLKQRLETRISLRPELLRPELVVRAEQHLSLAAARAAEPPYQRALCRLFHESPEATRSRVRQTLTAAAADGDEEASAFLERMSNSPSESLADLRRERLYEWLVAALVVVGLVATGALLLWRGDAPGPAPATSALDVWDGVGAFVRVLFVYDVAGSAVMVAFAAATRRWTPPIELSGLVAAAVSIPVSVAYLRWLLSSCVPSTRTRALVGGRLGAVDLVAWTLALFALAEVTGSLRGAIEPTTPSAVTSLAALEPSPTRFAANVLSSVLLGPMWEELVFRGVLFGALFGPLGFGRAALLAGVAFSLTHVRTWLGHVELVFYGILFAFAYMRTGSLIPLMLAHGLGNLVWALSPP